MSTNNSQNSISYGQAQQLTRNAIALAIVNNRKAIESLLKKYGVDTTKTDTDEKLIVALLVTIKNNKHFRQEFKNLLTTVTPANSKNFSMDGGFFFTAEEGDNFFSMGKKTGSFLNFSINTSGLQNAASSVTEKTTTTPKEKTGLGSFLSGNLDKILGTGLSTISTVITNKSNSQLADKALAIETEKTKQAALAAAGGNVGAAANNKGLSTGAMVAIGIGAAGLLGLITWLIVRKKK